MRILMMIAVIFLALTSAVCNGDNLVKDQDAILWTSGSGFEMLVKPPVLKDSKGVAIALALSSYTIDNNVAVGNYRFVKESEGKQIKGQCQVKLEVPDNNKADLIVYDINLNFDSPVRSDLTMELNLEVKNEIASQMILPAMTGNVQSYSLKNNAHGMAYFLMGKGSAGDGVRLALPAVNVEYDTAQLAIAADPYFGAGFSAQLSQSDSKATEVKVSCTYLASKVPLTSAERKFALLFHTDGVDGMLGNFYQTIPDIEAGPAWVHDIHLNYYDYLSQKGQGWFTHLDKLAEVIPQAYRKNVLVNLHGWYDYLGRYCYNSETKKLDNSWNALNNTDRQHPMSLADMHKRIRYAKDKGFRLAFYFADGVSSDSGLPEYRPEWQAKNEQGQPIKAWMGPGVIAQTYLMDPSNPDFQQWFMGRLNALLEEFGSEVDAFVWDETFQYRPGDLTQLNGDYAYGDRGMMILTSKLTKLVQSLHKVNPDLAFLTSDCLGSWGLEGHTALVSHGTYQDSRCDPIGWVSQMLNNYRNCLISCNWHPVSHASWNKFAAQEYGLSQGLSDGYGNYTGPAKMKPALLDEVIGLFLKNVTSKRQRTKYLVSYSDLIPEPQIGEQNWALASNGSVASASSIYSKVYGPAGVINGNRQDEGWGQGNGWASNPDLPMPQWLEVNFNESRNISRFIISTVEQNGFRGSLKWAVRNYEIQYWSETQNQWVTVVTESMDKVSKTRVHTLNKPLETTRFRVHITKSSPDNTARLLEVEAWGKMAPSGGLVIRLKLK